MAGVFEGSLLRRRQVVTQQSRSWEKRARTKWDSISARMAVPRARVWCLGGDGAEVSGDKDAVDLGLLFIEEADELVILLDGLEGLDEDGLAGGGGAVDDAGNFAFELGFDGNDETLAAHGDDVVGVGAGGAFFAEGAGSAAETGLDGAMLGFHGAADAAEFRAGVVGE